jgi:hypothetical protein
MRKPEVLSSHQGSALSDLPVVCVHDQYQYAIIIPVLASLAAEGTLSYPRTQRECPYSYGLARGWSECTQSERACERATADGSRGPSMKGYWAATPTCRAWPTAPGSQAWRAGGTALPCPHCHHHYRPLTPARAPPSHTHGIPMRRDCYACMTV